MDNYIKKYHWVITLTISIVLFWFLFISVNWASNNSPVIFLYTGFWAFMIYGSHIGVKAILKWFEENS